MGKSRISTFLLVVAAIFGIGLMLGLVVPRWVGSGSSARKYNTATLLLQVRTLSQLVTVQYVIEKIVVLEVPPDSMLGKMFAGENRVLMVAHGIVKGGIDFSKMKPEDLKVSDKAISIKLPPSQITDAYLDEKQTRVIERTTGRFRTFDRDLEQNVRQNAVDDIRRAARTGGILKDADDRARVQLENLFHQLGFQKVEFVAR